MQKIAIDKPIDSSDVEVANTLKADRNLLFIAKGGGITFAGKTFLALSRFLTAFLLARLLGAEQYGLYNLALSVSMIGVGLAVFGLDSALVRYIAILADRKDEDGVWGALQIGIGISVLVSILTGAIVFALANTIAEKIFHVSHLRPLLQLVGILIPVLALSEVLAGACRGFKRMDYPVIAQSLVQPVIRIILIIAVMAFDLNATTALITYGLADLSASILLFYYLNKEFPLFRPIKSGKRELKTMLGYSVTFWLSEMMLKFKNNIQTLLIGSLNNMTGVGIFSLANQFTVVSGNFGSAINTSAKPVIAALHDKKDLKQMEKIYQISNKWVVMVQLPLFLVMVLFPEQLLSIFGKSFMAGATTLIILAWADLISIGTGMGGTIIDMTGYTKLKLANSFFRLILYLVFNLLLIPQFGIVGAAISVLIGETVINLLRMAEVYYLFRLWPYNKSFAKPITAIILSLISSLLLGIWLPAKSDILTIGLHILLILIIYASVNLVLGISPEEKAVFSRMRQKALATFSRI